MSKKNNKADVEAAKDMSAPLNEQVVEQYLTPNPLSKFSMDTDALRLALVTAQFALRATRQPVVPSTDKAVGLLVLVNGMEQAGKGTAVTQLRQWIDPRLLKVEATIGDSPLAHQPIWQVHIKAIPRHGDVMVYFGNWYADLIYNVMRMATETEDNKKSAKNTQGKDTKALPIGPWQAYLRQHLIQLQDFEQDLAANQTKLLKCWFHVDIEILQARLNDDEPAPKFLYQIDWHDAAIVDKFNEVAVSLLRQQGDWVIIDCADKSQVARHFCHEVLHAMQKALVSSHIENNEEVTHVQDAAVSYHDKSKHKVIDFEAVKIPKLLTDIDKSDIDKSDYHKALAKKQARLAELLRARQGRHVVFAFEGMDAAGKGGTIKRLVAPLDPREYQIYNISAPMLYELQHPYLWRFWTKLPNEQTDRISRIAIFDRTWYGRVLVERIEGFATED
ncbi:MAG TPA: ATPase, partial [Psychrobacter sp.]|uniref:ATPase n=1 Tax=Psychrobacter sp. TaxID=56811 RepID=UPI002B6E92C7